MSNAKFHKSKIQNQVCEYNYMFKIEVWQTGLIHNQYLSPMFSNYLRVWQSKLLKLTSWNS